MKIIGIPLRKPTFAEITNSAILAAGLWLACVGIWQTSVGTMTRIEAGAALLVIAWSCLCVRLGIRIDKGPRHLAVNLLIGGTILAAYQVLVNLFA